MLIARLALNDLLTVRNVIMMELAKNIKNARMSNIEYYKHKNALTFAKIIK